MSFVTTPKDLEALRESGKRLARVLEAVVKEVRPGITAKELDERAEALIRAGGDTPAFLHYTPKGAKRPYPASLCVSLNDEVVHGIPNEKEKVVKDGDLVSLDIGLIHKGLYSDMATTVMVGTVDVNGKKLVKAVTEALEAGIDAARAGNTVGDIGAAVAAALKPYGYGIVRELGGHGIGKVLHDEPHIPNFGKRGEGIELTVGMALAIEPIINEGGAAVKLMQDGYTYKTADGSRSAHIEHTILITEKGPEIITKV